LIDLSELPVLEPLAQLLSAVQGAAGETPTLLVGAAARDLLLVHVHGIEATRATEDTDIGVAIPKWDTFLRVRSALLEKEGFESARGPSHRLWHKGQRVDLIPFGGVEREDRTVAWPPDGAEVMNVSGFAEALATAVIVRLPREISAAVASLPAQALLKVWAWKDRAYSTPGKDATDLWMLLRHYAEAGNDERLYSSEADVLTTFGFDMEEAGAYLLGKDAREVLTRGPDLQQSLQGLDELLRPEIDPEGPLRLVGQMPLGNLERRLDLLAALHAGLTGRPEYPRELRRTT
jgi:predicted nucleotidyltransferase